MRTVNRIFLVGHLGADPEVRLTATGHTVARLRLATNRSVREGETWTQVADWHRVVVFDRLAQLCGDQLCKGALVAVVGELRYNLWVDAAGGKRSTAEITARDISFLSGRKLDADRAVPAPAPAPALIPERLAE